MSLILDQKYLDKLRRYQVYAQNQLIYQVVTSEMDEDQIIKAIEFKFSHLKHPYRIYCNKKILKHVKFNRQDNIQKILDKETGEVYPDIYSFADNFEINIHEAKRKISKLHRFKYLK